MALLRFPAQGAANQLRKLYMGSLEDDEEKAQIMTTEELMKVSDIIKYKASAIFFKHIIIIIIIIQSNMDKMQRKELNHAASELKRAQNAKRAKKIAGGASVTGLGFLRPSEDFIMS